MNDRVPKRSAPAGFFFLPTQDQTSRKEGRTVSRATRACLSPSVSARDKREGSVHQPTLQDAGEKQAPSLRDSEKKTHCAPSPCTLASSSPRRRRRRRAPRPLKGGEVGGKNGAMIRQGEGRGGEQKKKQEARVSWLERQRRSREEKRQGRGECTHGRPRGCVSSRPTWCLTGGRREGGGGWWFGRGRKDGGEETAARRGEEFEKWTRAGF